MIKKCAVCGAEFEVELARRATKTCSEECRKAKKKSVRHAWRAKNREKLLKYHKEYWQEYREKLNRKSRECVEGRREKKRLYGRCYYWEHREEILGKKSMAQFESEYARELAYWNGLIERNEGWRRQ